MIRQATLRVQIQRRGKVERYDLALAPALLGSASHCDVRLAPDEAAECQLIVEPSATGIVVRSLAPQPVCLHEGAPIDELLLERSGVLTLGAISITVELLEDKGRPETSGSTLQTIRQVGMVGLLFVAAYFVLYKPPVQRALDTAQSPPPLFAAEGTHSCPQRDPEMALAYAEEQSIAADSKRERSPFESRDGVEAVTMYELAVACFELAGAPETARELERAAQDLRRKMEDELHMRHVRLEWFIGRAKYEAAQREVRRLRSLLGGSSDAYGQWLSIVERELGAMLEKQKKT